MGSTNSTSQNTTYKLVDSTLSLNGTGQKIGTASASATTDVSPQAHLNYSEDINLSWTGILNSIASGSRDGISGTIGNNTQLVQSVKNLGSAALRVGAGDSEFRGRVTSMVNHFLSTSVKDGVDKIINSTGQIPMKMIRDVVGMQVDIVNRLEQANDDFQTVSLGLQGVRNNEVSSPPTPEGLEALKIRATDTERLRADEIISIAGPRIGIIPNNMTMPPPDLIKNSLDTAVTNFGRVADLRDAAQQVTKESKTLNFSTLHAQASTLARSGYLKTDFWEMNEFIGMIEEKTPFFTAKFVPGGYLLNALDINFETREEFQMSWTGSTERIPHYARTGLAYKLTQLDLSREIRLVLHGTIGIVNQPYSASNPVRIGLAFSNPKILNPNTLQPAIFANKAVFINVSETHRSGGIATNYNSTSIRRGNVNMRGATNVMDDPRILRFSEDVEFNENESVLNLEAEPPVPKFTYVSNFSVAVNLNDVGMLPKFLVSEDQSNTDPSDIQVMLFVEYRDIDVAISVQTPILEINVVEQPRYMVYMGQRYDGTVLGLLGSIPDFYQSNDPHDPLYIYLKLLAPIISRSGAIATVHIKEGASLRLTRSHIVRARKNSQLPQLNEEELDEHIRHMLITVGKWMYSSHEIASYAVAERQLLFMRLIETVAFQTLYHVGVIGDRSNELIDEYLVDANLYNLMEKSMDKELITEFKRNVLR